MSKTLHTRKILIIKPSSLGDIVHSLPVLNVLYHCFPGAEIHWLVAKGFEGLLEGHPMLTRIWTIHKDEWKRIGRVQATIVEMRSLFKDLRAESFDYAVDLQGLLRSGIIAKATGARVRIGFKEAREGSTIFYTHRIEGGRDIHAVDRNLKIAAFLGCNTEEVRFPFPPTDRSQCPEIPEEGGYAVMAPGARGSLKRWPAERFGKLASRLPIRIVVIGSKGDRMLAEKVVKASRGNAVSLAGRTTLKELIEIIRGSLFMVSNDTGPMHIAAALGIHVFALFGPTSHLRTGPYGISRTIIQKEIDCSPCYKRTCKSARCMDLITVEEVAERISEFLSGQRDRMGRSY